ncbi:CD276 antigen homolog isoform X3 [Hyperolius riggenbachi]
MVGSRNLLSNFFLLIALSHSADAIELISGFEGEDVILPCFITYKEKFSYEAVNIHWTFKPGNIRVYRYFKGSFQETFQDARYRGRTKIFYEEIPEGNLSLLLKNIQVSDTGRYECLAFITKMQITHVELVIKDKTYGYTNESSVISLSMPVVIFCLLAGLCVVLRRRKKSRGTAGMSLVPESTKTKKPL